MAAPAVSRPPEPRSWAEYVATSRECFGSRSFSTVHQAEPAGPRYTRNVPTLYPLADRRHPLHALGEAQHVPNTHDGSLQRSQWHGWGDTSLLKEEGYQGQLHPRGQPAKLRDGKAQPAPPSAKDGRGSLFGTLQGTEAGGTDSWIGHQLIDPTKGKRALSAPVDPKGRKGLGEVLNMTQPGAPADDSWLGNELIDPARGKGKVPDPSYTRGRQSLFGIVQPDCEHMVAFTAPAPAEQRQGSAHGQERDPLADAWIGNRLMEVGTGKKLVEGVAATQALLLASTFRSNLDGTLDTSTWTDLARIGKRPLVAPSVAAGGLDAAMTLRMNVELPKGVVLPESQLPTDGKRMIHDPFGHKATGSPHVDMYALMTYKPLTDQEKTRCATHWSDAPTTTGKRSVHPAPGERPNAEARSLLAWQPNRTSRFVPYGGLAQERGTTLNAFATMQAASGTSPRKPAAGTVRDGGGGGGASRAGTSGAKHGQR